MSASTPSELIHRHQEARPDWLYGAPHHRAIILARPTVIQHRLGIRPRLHRRCLARRVRPSYAQSGQGERRRLPGSCHCILRQPRHQSAARDDRQRLVASVKKLFRQPANVTVYVRYAQDRTRPRPTERLSASSRRAGANGLMPEPTTLLMNAPLSCHAGIALQMARATW